MENKYANFDLSSFNFQQKTGSENVLDFIKNQKFFNNDVAKNLHYFFSNTPLIFFDDSKKKVFKEYHDCYKKIEKRVCWSEEGRSWPCHIAAPYLSVKNDNWNCIFGFARQEIKNSDKTNTFLHSFNSLGGKFFVDPVIQAQCNQQMLWVEKKLFPSPKIKMENFHSYFGVEIPKNIISDILFFEKDKHITGNLWWYLQNKVFVSKEKTEKFIEILNKNGSGWKYEPFIK